MTAPKAEAAEPAEARALVESYLARRRADRAPAPAPLVRRVGRRVVPQRFRLQSRVAATAATSQRARRRAAELAGAGAVRLHLGSGPVRKDGWVNIDLVGDDVDLSWNILKPLPFSDGSVDAIFHEHVLEHLSIEDGYGLARESYRLLRPGGVLRIGVPDCGTPDVGWPDAPTRLLALHEFFAEAGHQTMYDAETLGLLLRAAGFQVVEQRDFGVSRIAPAPDSEHRRVGSLYVEAVK
ncbi:MAG TPA: methyltransferase domain-containing protein [Gaiellaceae bacterium]|nr:methyltransferase domain-containing protein [Gaiellaceae bacterium]